jgi:hypothetical protein
VGADPLICVNFESDGRQQYLKHRNSVRPASATGRSATWAAGVSYPRILNNRERHGDVLKIATAADFCGTRWQSNAVIIMTPTNAPGVHGERAVAHRRRYDLGVTNGCVSSSTMPPPANLGQAFWRRSQRQRCRHVTGPHASWRTGSRRPASAGASSAQRHADGRARAAAPA